MGQRPGINVDPDDAEFVAGDSNCLVTPYDMQDGWLSYRREYSVNPDVCLVSPGVYMDMLSDSVLSDQMVTEETILKQPVIDWEKRISALDERTSRDCKGILYGMEILVDDDLGEGIVLLYEPSVPFDERSVRIDV